MAISFCRADAFARSRLATFAHAMSNTHPTAPSEPPLPKPMREDDDFVLAGLVLARRERAPEQRPRPEDVETSGRHPQAIEPLRLTCPRKIQVGVVERSETVEPDALQFPVEEHAGRNRVPFAWA